MVDLESKPSRSGTHSREHEQGDNEGSDDNDIDDKDSKISDTKYAGIVNRNKQQ